MSKKLKVAEIFYSIQGEGRYVGVPSIFLRTFGCNFKCEGFGMPRGEKSTERHKIMLSEESTYDNLPLVKTGCDSYASWDTKFKSLSPVMTLEEIKEKVLSLLPEGSWNGGATHLIVTGGEPLLGWQRVYHDLFRELDDPYNRLTHITFETNGTQKLTDEMKTCLSIWNKGTMNRGLFDDGSGERRFDRVHVGPTSLNREVHFSVSPKLSASGESWDDAIQADTVAEYSNYGPVSLKFVVDAVQDINEVKEAVDAYQKATNYERIFQVFLMPVGGTSELYQENYKKVAELAMENGYSYSPRLQVDIWKNAWGT